MRNQDKFIPTIATKERWHTVAVHDLLQRIGDSDERLIAFRMPVCIIDGFELVDVHHDHNSSPVIQIEISPLATVPFQLSAIVKEMPHNWMVVWRGEF